MQVRADPVTLTTDANGEAVYAEFDGTQPTNGVAARIVPPAESGYRLTLFEPSFNRFDLLDVEHVHDSSVPTVAFTQSPDGANGWWSGRPASVHVTASDARIDALACTVDGVAPRRLDVVAGTGTLWTDLTIRDEGRHAISCTAVDRSGNRATAGTVALIDLTNPLTPTLAADRAPEAAGGGWWADTVTVTATDNGDPLLADGSAGSGVDLASVPAPQTFATSGRHVVAATVADLAGNVSRTARLAVRVDADPPRTTLRCPASVRLGASASATWDDDDAESGLAGTHHGSVTLDTATPGTHLASHTATDDVGHMATRLLLVRGALSGGTLRRGSGRPPLREPHEPPAQTSSSERREAEHDEAGDAPQPAGTSCLRSRWSTRRSGSKARVAEASAGHRRRPGSPRRPAARPGSRRGRDRGAKRIIAFHSPPTGIGRVVA